MDPLRQQILDAAMELRGTPYRHRGCLPGVGIDCAMTVVWVCKRVGLLPHAWEAPYYSPEWHMHQNEEQLLQTLEAAGAQEIPRDTHQPGDILAFQYGRVCSHLGIRVADIHGMPYLVHAVWKEQVHHHLLSADLMKRLRRAYHLPGVAS
jgi:cell wall-associated NlpC family hydrolase